MKKLFLTLAIAAFGLTLSAQTAAPAAKKEKKAKTAKEAATAPTKGVDVTAPTDAAPAPKMKKDGTPDMRHKANKEAAKAEATPAGPMKKDGTPDMRYKANKKK
jgi:hypothetical protein